MIQGFSRFVAPIIFILKIASIVDLKDENLDQGCKKIPVKD